MARMPTEVPRLRDLLSNWRTVRALEEYLANLRNTTAGLTGTPQLPASVRAGVAADRGEDVAAARSDHNHAVLTGAPAVPVESVDGTAAEGTGAQLMRADATLVLSDDLETLMWMGC